jgi:hypothetical protein
MLGLLVSVGESSVFGLCSGALYCFKVWREEGRGRGRNGPVFTFCVIHIVKSWLTLTTGPTCISGNTVILALP